METKTGVERKMFEDDTVQKMHIHDIYTNVMTGFDESNSFPLLCYTSVCFSDA